jgi:hypothetical protein
VGGREACFFAVDFAAEGAYDSHKWKSACEAGVERWPRKSVLAKQRTRGGSSMSCAGFRVEGTLWVAERMS